MTADFQSQLIEEDFDDGSSVATGLQTIPTSNVRRVTESRSGRLQVVRDGVEGLIVFSNLQLSPAKSIATMDHNNDRLRNQALRAIASMFVRIFASFPNFATGSLHAGGNMALLLRVLTGGGFQDCNIQVFVQCLGSTSSFNPGLLDDIIELVIRFIPREREVG